MIIEKKDNHILEKVKKFQNSYYYIIAMAAVIFLFSSVGWDMVNFVILTACIAFTAITRNNPKCTMPPLFLGVLSVSVQHTPPSGDKFYVTPINLVIMGILAAIIIASFVYMFIVGKYKIKINGMFWGFVAIAAALTCGGFFYSKYDIMSLFGGLGLACCFFLVYIFYVPTLKNDTNVFKYMSVIFIAMSMVVALQLGLLYLTSDILAETNNKGYIQLGWGNSNNIGIVLLTCLPFIVYFMRIHKIPIIFFVIGCINVFAICFTFSRGSFFIAIPLFIAGTVYAIIKNEKRLQMIIGVAIVVIILGIYLICCWKQFTDSIRFYIEVGFNDRGRIELIKKGIKKFFEAPIFGAGFFDQYKYPDKISYTFLYHNTIIQYLACGGIIGLGLYLFHRFKTLEVFLYKTNEMRLVLGVSVACIVIYSLIDCAMFFPYIMFFYSGMIALADNDYTEVRAKNKAKNSLLNGDLTKQLNKQ